MNIDEAKQLACSLMSEWGLLDKDWLFVIDENNAKGAQARMGQCRYKPQEIAVSRWVIDLNPEPVVRDIILHEIAHAIAGEAGDKGHGEIWQAVCAIVGCKPCEHYAIENTIQPFKMYVATCDACGCTITKYKRPTKRRHACTCNRDWPAHRRPLLEYATVDATFIGNAVDGYTEGDHYDLRIPNLIAELKSATCPKAKKNIRARLRRLGHKGGLS